MILVTGATGKTARRVALGLHEQGHAVRALSRDAARARHALGTGVEIVEGEWDDGTLDRAMAGVDRVFLAVGTAPDQDLLEKQVIDAASRSGSRPHIVKLSTYGAERPADSLPPYQVAAWHRAAEAHLAASGLPSTVLRPNAYMDNLLASAGSVAEQDTLYSSTGDGRVSMVDTRDVADVALAVLTGDGHVGKGYQVTGGQAVGFPMIATTLSEVLGRTIALVPVDEATVEGALAGMGVPEPLVPVFIEGNRLIAGSPGGLRRPPRRGLQPWAAVATAQPGRRSGATTSTRSSSPRKSSGFSVHTRAA